MFLNVLWCGSQSFWNMVVTSSCRVFKLCLFWGPFKVFVMVDSCGDLKHNIYVLVNKLMFQTSVVSFNNFSEIYLDLVTSCCLVFLRIYFLVFLLLEVKEWISNQISGYFSSCNYLHFCIYMYVVYKQNYYR